MQVQRSKYRLKCQFLPIQALLKIPSAYRQSQMWVFKMAPAGGVGEVVEVGCKNLPSAEMTAERHLLFACHLKAFIK